MCFSRDSLVSHIALRLQLDSPLKLRTRLGPQYPHPTTPTTVGSFISPLNQSVGDFCCYWPRPVDSFGGQEVCDIGLTNSYSPWSNFRTRGKSHSASLR